MDNAILQRLPDRGRPADLAWKAPAGRATRHAQLFQAAIRAYEDGRTEAAERTWRQADGPCGPGRGQPTTRRLNFSSTRA